MPKKKNEKPRSKTASPAPFPKLPHELPIPPSPPTFVLDDINVPVEVEDEYIEDVRVENRSPSPSPQSPVVTQPPSIESEAGIMGHDVYLRSAHLEPSAPEISLPSESESEPGHSVSPVIHGEPSIMDNLARAVRSIYPPITGNSNPMSVDAGAKRRPLSIGSLIGNGFSRRRASAGSLISTSLSPLLTPLNVGASRSHNLPETTIEEDDRSLDPTLPEVEGATILFSFWFDLDYTRHYLFVGYDIGFQIWNISSLASIEEVVNVKDTPPFNGPVFCAAVITTARDLSSDSSNVLISILVGSKGTPDTELIIYSLTSHSVLHRISIPSALHLEANSDIIIVSSIKPTGLHLISTQSFEEIHTITNVASNVSFSLSTRLLAFACPPPQDQEKHLYSNPGVISRSPQQSLTPISGAIKVGQGIYSGMKTLSGLAFAAAASARPSDSDVSTPGQWFSKSAPAASPLSVAQSSSSSPRRRDSMVRSPPLRPIPDGQITGISHEGTWIAIVDFKTNAEVHRFCVSASKPVTILHWSPCGTILFSATSDGQTVSVYSIQPNPSAIHAPYPKSPRLPHSPRLNAVGSTAIKGNVLRGKGTEAGHPWHIYDLHRGHTSAKVLAINNSGDLRWTAAGTHRGTIHVFATNPYGGPSDIPSHMQGRVINADVMQPLSTSMVPLVRVRPTTFIPRNEDEEPTPMSIRFLTLEESIELPSTIAPPSSGDAYSRMGEDAKGYQDILVLHPTLGTLELFRITLNVVEPQTQTRSPPLRAQYARSGHSPPRGTLVEPRSSVSSPGLSGLSRLMDRGHGHTLQAKENSVATWNLKRDIEWPEVKRSLTLDSTQKSQSQTPLQRSRPSNWLYQAEITTFSRSPGVLAPSIYLSHQFSFNAFQEEYDALLRSHRFNIPTTPIVVRKEVEVKGENDMFGEYQTSMERPVPGMGTTLRRPFDEPMASALKESLDYSQSSPPTFPMLPNGSLRPTSFLDTLPVHIRKSKDIAMGVGEGLGKLRGMMGSSSSAGRRTTRESEHVQDFEDEELLDNVLTDADGDSHGDSLSHSHSGVSGSIHTPEDASEGADAASRTRLGESGIWNEWGDEEREVLEDAERFDEIYPAGVMDPDEGTTPSTVKQPSRGGGKGAHKGGRKGAG